MAYQYPPLSSNGNPVNYKSNIVDVTRSKFSNRKTSFCNALSSRNITVTRFDAVKSDVIQVRNAGRSGFTPCSVDCYTTSPDGKTYYFIEFKKSTPHALSQIGMNGSGKTIDESLLQKAFDSLAISSLTVLQGVSGKEIMDNAEFICVCLVDVAEQLDAIAFSNKMGRALGLAASGSSNTRVRWGLDVLKARGFYREVYTMDENEFVEWALSHLK